MPTYFQVIKEVLDQLYEDLPAENRDSQIQTSLTVPKPQTSGAKSDGRFGKQDFVYLPVEDAYRHTELAPQRL
ncbi:MAG: hypothetical protein JOZ94_01970 [Xanthobacteraceae bacterium]|nr:hypothetical protein [Xanthobacteraceae bacterium]MBV9234574.1 hypothetical protein [Xanthobacteraceae bacterium]MBV9627512.1 hypothetical protein [Xanthobacteraceae bacterium]